MNRWIMNRMGLINFWYYDKEEFQFSDGKLLLRGANGSGKSVTMQSFIPLLLDGNKSPERLDPFGSRARKIENYLLGEEDNREERTGYLYLEFKKEESDNYLTIGLGLRARRGKPMDSWGFSVTDGRRIGKDIALYKEMGEDIPLSKTELKNKIGDGGEVKEGQQDYMKMVNRLLFGFDQVEEYDELIKLLIQLRTPKLSKDFKPTVIYEIMNNSLQPLSDDDLRPISEAIENMDQVKSQLETLQASYKAAAKIKDSYDKYNRYMLMDKSKELVKSKTLMDTLNTQNKRIIEDRNKFYNQFIEADKKINRLKDELELTEEKENELKNHDSFKLKEQITAIDNLLIEQKDEKEKKGKMLDTKNSSERSLNRTLKDTQGKIQQQEDSIINILSLMDSLAKEFYFDEQVFFNEEFTKSLKDPFSFTYVKNQIKNYSNKVINGCKLLQDEKNNMQFYDEAYGQLEGLKKERETIVNQLYKAEGLLTETRDEFVEKMYQWDKENKILKMPRDILVELTNKIHLYGENVSYDDIISIVRKPFNEYEGKLNVEKSCYITEKNQLNENLKEKKLELEEWKNKKDPEPPREIKVVRNRERLAEMAIPHIPFYMAIDFKNQVPDEIRGILEEALMDMGILDALIIPQRFKKEALSINKDMADKYIFANPQYLKHELSQLLKAEKNNTNGITEAEIEGALKTILLDSEEEGCFINEEGQYGIGLLRGKVTTQYIPKYIGAHARRQHQFQKIEEVTLEINEINEKIQVVNRSIENIEECLKLLTEEYNNYPSKEDIETALNEVKKTRLLFEQKDEQIVRKEKDVENKYKNWQSSRAAVREATKGLSIPLRLEDYEAAREDSEAYKEELNELINQHIRLVELVSQNNLINQQYEEILQDIENLLYDFNNIDRSIKINKERLENYNKQLNLTDYEEIKKEIEVCIEKLKNLPVEIEDQITLREEGKANYKQKENELKDIEEKIETQERLYNINYIGFKKELELGYVYESREEKDLNRLAEKVYEELKSIDKVGKDKEGFSSDLQEKLHINRQYLVEYNMMMDYTSTSINRELEDELLWQVTGKQRRLEIKGRIQGKEVSFYSLMSFIEESIEENEKLLKESDRNIFEDILVNTIGKKIRAKIYNSREWVNKMNQLMESMNTSSGLAFNLSWKQKVRETEDQLDTRELVELLKMDANMLRYEDLNKISIHFRSKITEARKRTEDSGSLQTFHSIMKDILDYRKWFEFQLLYKKTGENKKELTNNAFDRFSGGEKAMAMYVPLFSSVYARYEGARKESPRIISLDEAFAGVDENNIRDMFRLLEELKLNFIINSQILWGDYDTISSLAICELIRPNNADYVTVIRYHWNGKVRELIVEEDLFEEELEDGDENIA
ncbi:TIGR02680 family protein [Alkaliphilus serpentinus]|nr:TIGR02680 family protein [Alkaliphilus serpentinus]